MPSTCASKREPPRVIAAKKVFIYSSILKSLFDLFEYLLQVGHRDDGDLYGDAAPFGSVHCFAAAFERSTQGTILHQNPRLRDRERTDVIFSGRDLNRVGVLRVHRKVLQEIGIAVSGPKHAGYLFGAGRRS